MIISANVRPKEHGGTAAQDVNTGAPFSNQGSTLPSEAIDPSLPSGARLGLITLPLTKLGHGQALKTTENPEGA